jgi:hypothetical protein
MNSTIAIENGIMAFSTDTGGAVAQGNEGFTFDSHGSEIVRFTGDGDVGIGTTSPSAALHVKSNGGIARLESTSATGNNYLSFYDSSALKGHVGYTGSSDDDFNIFQNESANIKLFTAGSERMRIDSSGNVGIGETSPSSYGKFVVTAAGIGNHINSTSGAGGINFYEGGSGRFSLRTLNGSAGLAFYDTFNGAERMRIGSNGNVAISTNGTTNDAKLIIETDDGKHPAIKINDGGANGFSLLADNYTATESILNLGLSFSSADVVLSRSVKVSDVAGDTYLSSQAQAATKPNAFTINGDGSFRFLNTDTSATTAVDTAVTLTERMRIKSGGSVAIGTTGDVISGSAVGAEFSNAGLLYIRNNAGNSMKIQSDRADGAGIVAYFERENSDGVILEFAQGGTVEGSISVSGATVSYNGFSGTHDSSGISTDIEVGTVVSTIDELDTYTTGPKSGQTRADHAKIKVSDTVGDARVYGVLSKFDENDKPVVASVGIGSVKVTGACNGGDLLESNGDGTAKVQSDDIIRSKTIGKVTIGNSDTGVKLVSCVLYCG